MRRFRRLGITSSKLVMVSDILHLFIFADAMLRSRRKKKVVQLTVFIISHKIWPIHEGIRSSARWSHIANARALNDIKPSHLESRMYFAPVYNRQGLSVSIPTIYFQWLEGIKCIWVSYNQHIICNETVIRSKIRMRTDMKRRTVWYRYVIITVNMFIWRVLHGRF